MMASLSPSSTQMSSLSSSVTSKIPPTQPFSPLDGSEAIDLVLGETSKSFPTFDGSVPSPSEPQPQMNSLEDVLNLTGISNSMFSDPPATSSVPAAHSSQLQGSGLPSDPFLSPSSSLILDTSSPPLLPTSTVMSWQQKPTLSAAQRTPSITAVGTSPAGLSSSSHQQNGSLGHTLIPSLIGSSSAGVHSQMSLLSMTSSVGKVPYSTHQPFLVSGISAPRPVSQTAPPKPQVTSWRWSSSPLQGTLGKRTPSSGSEEPAKKITTKGPDNSAEAVEYNIKQSLLLDLQRTQMAIKQLELAQQQFYRSQNLKEAKEIEQKIGLLIQRQKQIVQAIQSPSWGEYAGKGRPLSSSVVSSATSVSTQSSTSVPNLTSSLMQSLSAAPTNPSSSYTGHPPFSQLSALTRPSAGPSSFPLAQQPPSTMLSRGQPAHPPTQHTTPTVPPTHPLTQHATPSTQLTHPLTQHMMSTSHPLTQHTTPTAQPTHPLTQHSTPTAQPTHPLTQSALPGGPVPLSAPLSQANLTDINSQSNFISSPSFVAVSSGLSTLTPPPLVTSITSTTLSHTVTSTTLSHTVTSTALSHTITSTTLSHTITSTSAPTSSLTSTLVASTTATDSSALQQSAASSGGLPSSQPVQNPQSAADKSATETSSESSITAKEALILLNNPTLQDKLSLEKLQRLNSIRLQALQDYQKWQIQAFLASLPTSEMPKSLPDLKKILVEKKVEIQVPVYLTPRAIPRLCPPDLLQKTTSAATGPLPTVSSSSTIQPIPSLLGQSAGSSKMADTTRAGMSYGSGSSPGPSFSAQQQVSSPLTVHHQRQQQQHLQLKQHLQQQQLKQLRQQQQQQQQQQQHMGGQPWSDVHHRLKGIIASMEQQPSQSTLSSVYGGRHTLDQPGVGRSTVGVSEGGSSSSSSGAYMTRAQSRARQLAEIRAQQMKRKLQTSEESYITTHMKAMLTRDHSNLFDTRPFSSSNDAIERLLSYHVFHDETDTPDKDRKFDLLHKHICSLLVKRQMELMARYHKIVLEDSQREVSKGLEVSSLREFVDLITPPPPSPPEPLAPTSLPAQSSPSALESSFTSTVQPSSVLPPSQLYTPPSWIAQSTLGVNPEVRQSSSEMSSWPPLPSSGYISSMNLGNL